MSANNDASRRFILPGDAPLLSNLAALWAVEPALAAAIEMTDGQPSYHTESSKSGPPTVCADTPDGKTIQLHSRYDPVTEAQQFIDSLQVTEAPALFVHGFALGYHVERLFQCTGDETILCILEPDLRMLRTAFEQRDFSRLIRSRRVIWIWRENKSDLFAKLWPHQPLVTIGFARVMHSPSVQLQQTFHAQVQQWIAEFESYAKTTVSTLVINSRRTAENVAMNLPWYVAAPGVARLQGAYRGLPGIIVSAGPSLRKNIHQLKAAQGRAVLIAVQTTLKPLLEMGIEADFVTSLDYHEICTRFFEQLPQNLRSELVALPKASPAILAMNRGPLSILGDEFAEMLLSEMKLNLPRLRSGATVAHLAYYLAEHLGCDPIIFIGQDLGFSDGLCYTPGTSYDDVWRPELSRFCTLEMKQWEQIVRDRTILRKVPDHQNRPMYTEERLFTYLQHFERDFAQAKSRIIDATEGGVLKRGTASMRLVDAISRFCTRPISGGPSPHPGYRWERVAECVSCLKKRREEAAEIQRISRQTLPLLEQVRDHIADQNRVNRAIARIDDLRRKIDELGPCYQLIMQLTQHSELARYKADRRIAAARIDGIERQRQQVQRDIENVRAVIEAADEFRRLLDRAIDNAQQYVPRRHREAA